MYSSCKLYKSTTCFNINFLILDETSNDIRVTAHVKRLEAKLRERRRSLFGHVQRRDKDHIGEKRMLRLELPGKRKMYRLKRKYMADIREDMKAVGLSEDKLETK